MNIKVILYCLVVPLSIWSISSINFNNVFKKNSYYSSRFLYLFLSLGLSYLVVNFFYDFFVNFKFIFFNLKLDFSNSMLTFNSTFGSSLFCGMI